MDRRRRLGLTPAGRSDAVTPANRSARPPVVRNAILPPEPSSARVARRLLHAALQQADRTRWSESSELALSEYVTNAILHAHTPFTVRVQVHDDAVHVEVQDDNPAPPRARGYGTQATTGRGLGVVTAVTSRCGVRQAPGGGKVLWFRLDDTALWSDGSATSPVAYRDVQADWAVPADWYDARAPDEARAPDDARAADAEGGRTSSPGSGTRLVVLARMPATLWLAARQHHDALLRELALYTADNTADHGVAVDLALADRARTVVSGGLEQALEEARRQGRAVPPLAVEHHDVSLPAVPRELDLRLQVPVELASGYSALRDALDLAERLAGSGRLLAWPGLPEIVAVRNWVCDQVISQLGGAPASPWPGTAQPRFETAVPEGGVSDLPTWDAATISASTRGVIAADETNRIVAVSRRLAHVLGWRVEDLVGRRVVTIIPPRLREAHIAGFSAHLSTGKAHILGVSLELPALRADGTEIMCRYLVESASSQLGHAVYLAWIEPLVLPAGGPPAI